MSYDISLKDKTTGEIIILDDPHDLRGGTYAMFGTDEAWLNVTYNYAKHFAKIFGEKGIRSIYGMTAKESIPILAQAITRLGDDVTNNYWEATEGNAKKALLDLLILAELAPLDSIWDGD